jgi:arginase family enzyme
MNLLDFIEPVSLEKPEEHFISNPNILGKNISIHTPDFDLNEINNQDLILLGIPEDRNSFNKGSSLAPDHIRTKLLQFLRTDSSLRILDLGNLKQGNTFNDTYFALREVLEVLLAQNLVVILIGGTQELTVPIFQAFEGLKSNINLSTIDRTIDLVKDSVKTTADTYLTELLFRKRLLFKYNNLGHQIHLTDKTNIDLINKLYHDAHRLGEIRSNMTLVEPVLRDSDIVSFDISAIRQSDSPGHHNPSPSGFTCEEACQLARYAGLSDNVSVFGLFEYNPKFDTRNQSANVVAQLIWYFIDGLSCRSPEEPTEENKNFKTFIVGHSDLDYEITFYKSLVSERWWMEVPDPKSDKPKLISCSHNDYKIASEQEVPDLWWKSFQKLS